MTFDIYSVESNTVYPKGTWGDECAGMAEIHVFGRERDTKKKVHRIVKEFKPCLWVEEGVILPDFLSKYSMVHSYASLTKETMNKMSLTNKRLRRIITQNPKTQQILKRELESLGITTYEADLPLRLAYTRDIKDEIVKRGITFSVKNCRIFVLDIETTTSHSDFPDPGLVPESIISISLHDNFDDVMHSWIWKKGMVEDTIMSEDWKSRIHTFCNEEEMLQDFLRFWVISSPDIIVGHNILGFDAPYIMNRMKKLNINFKKLSPLNSAYIWEDRKEGRETYHNCIIPGVVLFDTLHWYREVVLNEMRGYSLEAIAKDEGLGVKGHINPEDAWNDDWKKLIEYNVNDVVLTKAICDKKKLIDFVSGIRQVVMCNFDDLVYFSRAIDMLHLLRAKDLKVILPTKPTVTNYLSKEDREAQFEGGFVFAEKGLYKNVGVFDFNSLYPRIIQTFNLSYELIRNEKCDNGRDLNGVWFDNSRKGITPDIIETLVKLRAEYEEGLKLSKTSKESEEYDNLIQATKNLICTVFGVGANPSFRLFDQRFSSTITYIGRTMAQEISRYAKEIGGYHTVYQDTDSVFIEMDKFDIGKGIQLQEILNQRIKDFCFDKWGIKPEENSLSLKFEKLYQSLLVDTKKRYAGWLTWKKGKAKDDITVTGMQSRRSDASTQAHFLQTKVLELILRGESKEKVKDLIYSEIGKLQGNNVDYEYIALPVKIGKLKYENNLPKTRGLEMAKKILDIEFKPGMKILLLYLKSEQDMVDDAICFERNSDLIDKDIKIDASKMITRNVKLILQSILSIAWGEKDMETFFLSIDNKVNGQLTLII